MHWREIQPAASIPRRVRIPRRLHFVLEHGLHLSQPIAFGQLTRQRAQQRLRKLGSQQARSHSRGLAAAQRMVSCLTRPCAHSNGLGAGVASPFTEAGRAGKGTMHLLFLLVQCHLVRSLPQLLHKDVLKPSVELVQRRVGWCRGAVAGGNGET